MSDIAHPMFTQSLDTAAKWFRTILGAGVTMEQLMLPVQNRTARTNLAAYLAAGCPKLAKTDTEPVSPALRPLALKQEGESVEWSEDTDFDPQAYFKTRSGLWVSDEFRSRILSKAGRVSVPTVSGFSRDLARNAYDREITGELADNLYLFNESEACAYIAQLIDKQPGGIAGQLLNNGYANLFYVAGCVVSVYWSAGSREWNVRAWKLDDDDWSAGYRVFSRT